jgi:hypothetical protein
MTSWHQEEYCPTPKLKSSLLPLKCFIGLARVEGGGSQSPSASSYICQQSGVSGMWAVHSTVWGKLFSGARPPSRMTSLSLCSEKPGGHGLLSMGRAGSGLCYVAILKYLPCLTSSTFLSPMLPTFPPHPSWQRPRSTG